MRCNRILRALSLALLGAALAIAPAIPAAAVPPTPAVCDQDDTGERIKCKTLNLLDQQEVTTEMMGDLPGMSANRMARLGKQVNRARKAEQRTMGAEFKELSRRRDSQCHVLPADPADEDGICTGNEDCAELLNDGIGDDDGICKRTGKPSEREVCAEICDEDALAQPDNFDDDPSDPLNRAADIEEALDDATDEQMELNEMLEGNMANLAAAQALSLNGNACGAALESRANETLIFSFIVAATTTKAIADQFGTVCQQDAAGFNSSTVCLVFETIAGIARLIADGFEFADANVDSSHIDATLACVKELDAAAGDTQAQLDAIETQLSSVQAELGVVRQQLVTTIDLLKTPQGQREGFSGQ